MSRSHCIGAGRHYVCDWTPLTTNPACMLSCQQVVAAAAARLQQERVARAAQEAATLSMQAARVAALNKQAQVHMQRKRAQKQQLAVRLRAVARGLSLLGCVSSRLRLSASLVNQ